MTNKIYLSEQALDYLNNLMHILYEKHYFSDRENAQKYVVELYSEIEKNIHIKRAKIPDYRRRCYGKHTKYVTFRKNRHTTYIVFFEKKNDNYLIEYIGNNYTDGQYINNLQVD